MLRVLTRLESTPRTIGHDSSVLIFDELEYEPFTENRQWPSGKLKIARCEAPAMPHNREDSVIRAGIDARRRCVSSCPCDKLLMLLSDLNRPASGRRRRARRQLRASVAAITVRNVRYPSP